MIVERQVDSLESLLQAVKNVRAHLRRTPTAQEEIWFRGQGACSQHLVPGLYRPEVLSLGYDEGSIFEHFKALANPLVRREPTEWEWHFLAQHHRLRTRLLDWTENLLAAVHFALSGEMEHHTQTSLAHAIGSVSAPLFDNQCPVVWMIDAGSLNFATCGADKDYIFVVPSERADRYLPGALSKGSPNDYPIAILSPRSNDRIVAQQGCFTIHGLSRVAIEELASDHQQFHVGKFVFDRANLAGVWDDLQTCGVHVLSLFPDLDSVAKCVLWMCQNEVTPEK
jgi:hypothetical protein